MPAHQYQPAAAFIYPAMPAHCPAAQDAIQKCYCLSNLVSRNHAVPLPVLLRMQVSLLPFPVLCSIWSVRAGGQFREWLQQLHCVLCCSADLHLPACQSGLRLAGCLHI